MAGDLPFDWAAGVCEGGGAFLCLASAVGIRNIAVTTLP